MDNVTVMNGEPSPAPINRDDTYSRLRAIPTNANPCYELQRRAFIQSETERVKQDDAKEPTSNTKFNNVLITMMIILLLLMLTSIVLSVATFSQLTSKLETLTQVDNQINEIISARISVSDISLESQSQCGPGLWRRVAYLDMTDPSQQCPSAWREYNTSGVKACGRPANSTGSCATEFYCTNHQYSQVCGRIIGYQVASPDAFSRFYNNFRDLDGVIISHGAQQEHIWSYTAGLTERGSRRTVSNCPCSTVAGAQPPTNIGDNYYCESGNPTNTFEDGQLYSNDPLWDGHQCEGTCCTGTKSPPWFSVQLPAPTTDFIEVSICCDEDTMNEDTPVELIEIYVQ